VPILDVNRNAIWVSHVESLIPPVDVVYTNNSLIERLFEERGYKVHVPLLFNRKEYSGSEIRKRMLNKENWKVLVPEAVTEVIEEIDGLSRMLDLRRCDT
jgi:nicotinamide-nucleotide adenylyltransferase